MFSDGSTAEFRLEGLPCPQLVSDLLTGLVELIHPHGSLDAANSVDLCLPPIRNLAQGLAAQGFSGGAAELRRGRLIEYWMATRKFRWEGFTRRMLKGFDTATGHLDPGVRELLTGRSYSPTPHRQALPPYSEAEWSRLTTTCQTIVSESYATHRQALEAAARGRTPTVEEWTRDNLAWLLARLGPVGTPGVAEHLGCSLNAVQKRGGVPAASAAAFPHLTVVVAYRLLFGIYSGIVPDGIDDLGVEDIDWAGDSTILLSYVKGRAAGESVNLPKRAVRLLEQWLAHSALLRSHADPETARQLWLGVTRPGTAGTFSGAIHRNTIKAWTLQRGLTGDDGKPLKIHRGRIRTTHLAMRDRRAWNGQGRATIDPNHSPQVEGDHYLTATTPSQQRAVDALVEDAQHDLLRRAHPPTVVTDEDAAALARDCPQLINALQLDNTVIAELVGGERDVFTAACADQLSGLHGPKGKPCPARPWVCLLCPLAVFAPRHVPNLLRLKAFFSRQWQQMPAAHFMAVFGPYSQRIGHVLDRFDPAVVADAATTVDDHDDELPLRPEETTL
ncbi:hypothetical protein [Streptomyces tailanensis]|uniref:hypothetical protein n=1 Tax=Streptomyces tailanensis TaxID=2569858 RepID=UPI001FE82D2C|nr:hypothetical protein [Streptomyces tailanensis]